MLSVKGETNLGGSLWRRKPTAVQLRPAYPGASIGDVAFLTDGRLSLLKTLPGQPANPAEAVLEAWVFDPDTGSLKPMMENNSSPRAQVLSVSPDAARGYRDHAWWTPAEMLASNKIFLPMGLAKLLAPVVRGDVPAEPLTIV